jgi:uncharacterized protein (DUF58 family)
MKKSVHTVSFLCMLLLLVIAVPASAQSKHERKVMASEQIQAVPGGEIVTVPLAPSEAFQNIMTYYQRLGQSFEVASPASRELVTAIAITGKRRQTGTRLRFTVMPDDKGSAIRVAVTEQHRMKILQADPWSDSELNAEATSAEAAKLKTVLTANTVASRQQQ